MALDLAAIQLLCCARSMQVDFSEMLMIGRQTILCDRDAMLATLAAVGIATNDADGIRRRDFAEPVLRLLGAQQVSSLDASDYEAPTYVCDLNLPHPGYLSQKFSLVYDGGSLEHVFNIPQALRTCMDMVRLGGTFVQLTVANNYMGHGFWQLSPETVFRVFSRVNGYAIKGVFLHEVEPAGAWYQVSDPAAVHSRVELVNNRRTYICTIAERISDGPIFTTYPAQSDYAELWRRPGEIQQPRLQKKPSFVKRMVPELIRRPLRFARNAMKKAPSPFDRPYYRRISADNLISGRLS
jgi:hypothetical protein